MKEGGEAFESHWLKGRKRVEREKKGQTAS